MNIHLLTPWRFAWRQLRSAPGQAAIVIIGLALGVALTLLTAAFVSDKLWADAGLPEAERLLTFEWRVRGPGGSHSEWLADVPATPLYQALRESGAPVGAISRVLFNPLAARADDGSGKPRRAKLVTLLADADLPALFRLRAVAGDLAAAIASPEGIALTEAGAEKLFGTTQVLGRPLTVSITYYGEPAPPPVDVTLTVMAVLPTPSLNGALGGYEALTGMNAPAARAFVEQESSWNFAAGKLFARLAPGADAAAVSAVAQHLQDQQPAPPGLPADFLKGGGPWASVRAMRLADWGLNGAGSPQRRLRMGGLAAAAVAVLALSLVNFINLWSVRTLQRQREIGLRKSLGAGVAALLAQFFIEALLVAGLAGALGLLLAWWATPALSVLMQHSFDSAVLAPAMLALTGLLCIAVAGFSALPLASIALRVRPAESLAGRSHSEGPAGRWLRRALTIGQFGTAALFSAMTVVVLWQNDHAERLPRGIEVENRLAFDLPWDSTPAQNQALLHRIQAGPEVIAAAASNDVPGRDFASWYAEFRGPGGGSSINLRTSMGFSPGWLKVYGIPLLAGRLSADHAAEAAEPAVVLDRSAALALGFATPQAAIGQRLGTSPNYEGGKPVTVVAVIADLRFEGTRSAHVANVLRPWQDVRGGAISVHSRDPAATRRRLADLLKEALPDDAIQVLTVREQQARKVEDDARLGHLTGGVSLLALLLAAIGIYALAAYTLRRREREIVLRKLHGAGHWAVAKLLFKEFGAVVGAACLVALPLAAWLGERYLSEFVERAPMGAWPLVIATLALLIVTSLAVLRHLLAAFALRPAQALQG